MPLKYNSFYKKNFILGKYFPKRETFISFYRKIRILKPIGYGYI